MVSVGKYFLRLRISRLHCSKRQLPSSHIKKVRLVDVKDQLTKPAKKRPPLGLHKENVHEKVVADQHIHKEDLPRERPGFHNPRKYTIRYHSQVRDCSKTSTSNKLVGNSGQILSSPNSRIYIVVWGRLPWHSCIMFLDCLQPKMPRLLCLGLRIFRIV